MRKSVIYKTVKYLSYILVFVYLAMIIIYLYSRVYPLSRIGMSVKIISELLYPSNFNNLAQRGANLKYYKCIISYKDKNNTDKFLVKDRNLLTITSTTANNNVISYVYDLTNNNVRISVENNDNVVIENDAIEYSGGWINGIPILYNDFYYNIEMLPEVSEIVNDNYTHKYNLKYKKTNSSLVVWINMATGLPVKVKDPSIGEEADFFCYDLKY